MRRHLAFIRKYRKVLRLKLNAAENLLVDGAREPEHRGVCKHLLSKVDRAAAVAALARKPVTDDVHARAAVLAGVVRITGDVSLLLMWLDALSEGADPGVAARAFSSTVDRMDFAALSSSQFEQLLAVFEKTFSGHDRVQVLFGLLQSGSFRTALDAAADALAPDLAAQFVPLRAVFDAHLAPRKGRRRRNVPVAELEAGLELLLSAPPEVLKGYREDAREALLLAALHTYTTRGEGRTAIKALLASLPARGAGFARAAWRWACRLLADREDDTASSVLRRILAGHPDHERASMVLDALGRPRIGRFALDGDSPVGTGLRGALSLETLRRVRLRASAAGASDVLSTEAELHAQLCLPGVLPVITWGTSPEGVSYVAVPEAGVLLPAASRDLPIDQALALALAGVQVLRGLALAGVQLPDLAPDRFVVDLSGAFPSLLLADLRKAIEATPTEAERAHRPIALEWCRAVLAWPPLTGDRPRREAPRSAREAVRGDRTPPPLTELANEAVRWPLP